MIALFLLLYRFPQDTQVYCLDVGQGDCFVVRTGEDKCFLFDAEGEYEKLVRKNKGEYIDMYSASGGIINPLQVRFLPSDKEEQQDSDVDTINYEDCPLAKHLGSLETFIKLETLSPNLRILSPVSKFTIMSFEPSTAFSLFCE